MDDSLARPEVGGVVIAQGTDTMEETAYWLDLTVKSSKPVVMIGAKRNASSPDFDGPRNLLNAIRIATTPEATGKGVMVAMNNQINAARSVTKTHNGNVETFRSGDLGFVCEVWDDKVVFSRAPLRRQHIDIGTAEMPHVEILAMFGGADGSLNALCRGPGRQEHRGAGRGHRQHGCLDVRGTEVSAVLGRAGSDLHPGAQRPHVSFRAAARPRSRRVR